MAVLEYKSVAWGLVTGLLIQESAIPNNWSFGIQEHSWDVNSKHVDVHK